MSDLVTPETRAEAYENGRAIAEAGKARLHDLTGQMVEIGIPVGLRGNWLSGVEDFLDPEGLSSSAEDGYGWEDQALAQADRS